MVILHIASISKDPFNGVCVAVPQHVQFQSQYETVAFINVRNEDILGVPRIVEYDKRFDINNLPNPFNKPDLVVFHECYRIEYLQIAKNLVKNNVPYIIVPHGELNEDAQKKKKIKKMIANILLFNRFVKSAVAVQCLSSREFENTHFGREKIIGTNGVKMPKKHKEQFNTEGVRFVYIGRLDAYHKGLDLLCEAISIVSLDMRNNNCFFEIYGPDINGRANYLKGLIEKYEIDDLIIIGSQVSGEEKEKILLNTDVFIQTSRFEGMPLGIQEALSLGIPCAVTEGTTLGRDIEKNNCGWCAENTSKSISDMLLDVVSSRDAWEEKSIRAIKYIKEYYSWQVVSKNTIEEYRKLLNRG